VEGGLRLPENLRKAGCRPNGASAYFDVAFLTTAGTYTFSSSTIYTLKHCMIPVLTQHPCLI
jgi:hypothetical protein